MHPLIDTKIVDAIRTTGNTNINLPDRVEIMNKYGLPYDRKAENVIITGCQIIGAMPEVLVKLTRIMDYGGLSHTFLSKEYCCGNNLYRPAIKARDDTAMAECRVLSKEFVELNLTRAKELGASRTIIFCSPCYFVYKYACPDADIVFYPQAVSDAIGTRKIEFPNNIDYYAGCYRLHRKIADVPMDLKSTNEVFSKMDGISVNRISAPSCCYKPDGLNHMIESIRTDTMVHICTGCYYQALLNKPQNSNVNILMLPDLIADTLKLT